VVSYIYITVPVFREHTTNIRVYSVPKVIQLFNHLICVASGQQKGLHTDGRTFLYQM